MKIAIFSDTYLPQVNGIAASLGLLNEQFHKLGHKVQVFTPDCGEVYNDPANVVRIKSVKISQSPSFYLGSPISWPTFTSLKRSDCDIIHAHSPLTIGILAYQTAKMLHKPLIYTYHTMIPQYAHYLGWPSKTRLGRKLAQRFDLTSCNASDLIVAPSLKIKNFLETRGVSTKVEVVPNGIKLERFHGINKGYLRRRGVNETDKILLFVGRLAAEKNPAFLIHALAQVRQHLPEVKLVFAGSGPLLPQLQQLTAQLNLNANVIFLGDVPFAEMPALYADTDIFVTASTTEVHSIAMLEAIASALPVVAVNDAAFATGVFPGQNGFLVPLEQEAFAQNILTILQNPALQQHMSTASLKISNQFSVETQTNKLIEIYSTLTAYRQSRSSQYKIWSRYKFL